jgi:serine/threonine-protein kinase
MAGSRRIRRFAAFAPACGLFMLGSSLAQAQTSAADKAAAEALFDQGVRLMKQNSFAEACPKLEESERIDPAVGTLLYLGECFERVGRTASAWASFREAASLATNSSQPDRARVAMARAQELEPKLSRLSIELSPEVSRIEGVVVKRGNQRIEASVYGVPLPVDPAEYRVEVTAPGYEPWSTSVKVEAGGNASVRVPALVKAPESAKPLTAGPTTGAPSQADVQAPPAVKPPAHSGLSTQQTLGIVLGGVGLVGIGIGSYFGVRAISKNSDAEQHCPRGALCNDQEGEDLTNKAQSAARASNIAFAIGGGLVAAGAIVYLTGGKKHDDRVALVPVLGPGSAAGSLVGRF